MGLGQTMMTAAFFVVMTTAVLNANRMLLWSQQQSLSAEAFDHAANMAQALLTEVGRKKFDQNEIDGVYQLPANFATPATLGPEAGETMSPWPDCAPFKSLSVYNDADDYNNYVRMVDLDDIKGFKLTVKVSYVATTNLNLPVSLQSYFKRVDVSVEHPQYLPKITYSTLVTY